MANFRGSLVTKPGGGTRLGQTPWLQGGGTFQARLAPGHRFCLDRAQGWRKNSWHLGFNPQPPPPARATPLPSSKVRTSDSRLSEAGTRTPAILKGRIQKEGCLASRETPEPELPELGVRVPLYLVEGAMVSSTQTFNEHLLCARLWTGNCDLDGSQTDTGPEAWQPVASWGRTAA